MATFLLIIIYFAFISLGLPDSLLGATWPIMQPDFGVPYSFAGIASMVISGGTIISSLLSGRVINRFGTGKVTFVSVLMTAVALLGFSLAPSFPWIVVLAIPLGLGAGAVDSGLNEYVAEHYKSHHMSWLHCFWGIGAMSGPLIMSQTIALDHSWRSGYLIVSIIQWVLVVILFFSIPIWKQGSSLSLSVQSDGSVSENPAAIESPPGFFSPLKIRGVKYVLMAFFFYCGIEATMGLWGGSYLVRARGLDPVTAAEWVSLFYASITFGRLVTGFVTMRLSNPILIRAGTIIIICGIVLLFLPLPALAALIAFVLIGLGCAPIFPIMLHETPGRFGKQSAQQVMSFQMAVAYVGSTFLPPLFGFVASNASLSLLPVFVIVYGGALLASSELVNLAVGWKKGTSPG
jgi:fucose permease